MTTVRIVVGIVCAILWYGWYYLTALGCGFGNGQKCGPFQGNPDMTIAVFWGPLACIAVIYLAIWLIGRR
jgi:hypothetical protein